MTGHAAGRFLLFTLGQLKSMGVAIAHLAADSRDSG